MSKVIRFGDLGPSVLELQLFLSKLGFSPGPTDGIFGFLTEETLIAFQRTYGLKPDGLAGAAIWQMMAQRELPLLQFPQPLSKDRDLGALEREFKLAAGTLRQVNRQGSRVISIPQRRVLALWDLSSCFQLDKEDYSCLAVGPYLWGEGPRKAEDFANLEKEGPHFLWLQFDWGILAKRRQWSAKVEGLCKSLAENSLQGLLLELAEGEGRWRRRLVALLKILSRELAKRGFSLYLKLPARRGEDARSSSSWSLDYGSLGALAGFVVVDFSQGEEGYSYSRWVQTTLQYIKSVIPPWKLLPLISVSYSSGQTKQLLLAEQAKAFGRLVLFQRLGGITLFADRKPLWGNCFVVEGRSP